MENALKVVEYLDNHPQVAKVNHPSVSDDEEQGIKPNTIRLSIGTENIDDIIEDLEEAFKAVR